MTPIRIGMKTALAHCSMKAEAITAMTLRARLRTSTGMCSSTRSRPESLRSATWPGAPVPGEADTSDAFASVASRPLSLFGVKVGFRGVAAGARAHAEVAAELRAIGVPRPCLPGGVGGGKRDVVAGQLRRLRRIEQRAAQSKRVGRQVVEPAGRGHPDGRCD